MKTDSIKVGFSNVAEILPVWIYIAAGVLCIVLIVWMVSKYRHSKYYHLKKVLKNGTKDLDFDKVINSAFHAQELYDILKKVCHPDKFATEPELCEKATEIFALLVKNKHDYGELLKLQERIRTELKINI